jgi:hypothetical protein
MKIYQKALDKVAGADLTGSNLVAIFNKLFEMAGGAAVLNFRYITEEDDVPDDEVVPAITLALMPAATAKSIIKAEKKILQEAR